MNIFYQQPQRQTLRDTVISKNNQGFTIVELLIVIVVIAILAAISIVSYTGIQGKAKDATTKSDIGHIDTVVNLANIADGALPSSVDGYKSQGLNAIADKMVWAAKAKQEQYAITGMYADELSLYYWSYADRQWVGIRWRISDGGVRRDDDYTWDYRDCQEPLIGNCQRQVY